jgi:hypothetical protein
MTFDDEMPLRLRRTLYPARRAKNWSLEKTARKAVLAIRSAHATRDSTTADELVLWSTIEITLVHVAAFEDYHKSPLGTAEKRARLLGIALALDLDPAKVSRAAGAP